MRNHLATIYRELGIRNKTDLVRLIASASEAKSDQGSISEPVGSLTDPTTDVEDDVLKAWLQTLSLAQYADLFAANAIDWPTLPTLGDDDLQTLGVAKLGHRKRLLQAIAELSVGEETESESVGADSERDPAEVGSEQPERRHLTIMFCDLVASTALAERLDPEDMLSLMGRYRRVCTQAVERYGGHIAKYMGDAILTYFGWPQAHEEDAERALRAGLALLEAVGRLEAYPGEPLQLRIGVATGTVVVGDTVSDGVSQEHTVIGSTPNLAAHLQKRAEPNSLVVGPTTRELAGRGFEYRDLGQQIFKGLQAPVQVWQVLRVRPLASRFESRVMALTPLAGRQVELQLLQERWQQAAGGEGQVVLLTGEAGIGKSRIVHELLATLFPKQERIRRYQCSPFHNNTALYPFIAHLNQQLEQQRKTSAQDKTTALAALVADTDQPPEQALALLAILLSLPLETDSPALALSAQQRKQATLKLLRQLVLADADQQPLLLVLEDLHWLDPSSGELLEQLIDALQALPALFILTTRPGLTVDWTAYTHVTALTLNRLNREQALAMVETIAVKPLPLVLQTHIVDESDGIPLFIEEMTKAALESDALIEQPDRYVLASNSALTPKVPATLQDALVARLDRLGPAKQIAQTGAVIGREFSYSLLASVSELSEPKLLSGLDRLVASGLVFRRSVQSDACYIFKHALVQDAAYDCLLRAKRQQLHGLIAQALEHYFPNLAESEPELLALHYTGAEFYEQALDYWLKAGERAVERSANQEAVEHLQKGLELIGKLPNASEQDRRELALLAQLGPAFIAARGYGAPETARCFDRARELTSRVGDAPQLFPVLYGCWVYKLTWAEYPTVRRMAEQFLRLARQHDNVGAVLTGHRIMGFSCSCLGNFSEARENFEQVLALYQQQHASLAYRYGQDPKAAGAAMLAWNLWHLGYPDQAVHICDAAVAYAHELNHTNTRGYVETFGAVRIQLFRRDLAGVEHYVNSMEALCEEQKLIFWIGFIKAFKGWLLSEQNRYQKAIDTIQQGLVLLLSVN